MNKEKKIDLSKISTEQRNNNTINIDIAEPKEIARLINEEDKLVAIAVEKELTQIGEAIAIGEATIRNGGRIIYIGAGTSGRLGVLDASEIPPTYNAPSDMFIGLIAGGDYALRNAVENAEDSADEIIKDLNDIKFSKKDFLVGIAASGRTPYVVAGLEYANKIGAKTMSISTSANSQIGKIANITVDAVVGPEAITGSTRMKSGTAQKLVLNTLSTGIMVRLGKVYKNLMIDVKPANAKLIQRCINIVFEITSANEELIKKTLEETNYSCKLSSVMIIKDLSKEDAQQLLNNNNGYLRKVIDDE